ncbi:protein TIME FOR COFFEE-like isoform X1 [Senna tora]|uniref:Protein TIME FOR COFFEE-like isoform X1 n=1 Tax=Senna tora TaxID=362788 RepID=A0A834TC10_9FABA|nr:protein TIME FOR COFFEE-like isoform X1 [Senna tora]
MDRTREARRLSTPTTTHKFPRRRYRTIGLKDSSEEGQVELPETVRLRAVVSKRDRNQDRDSSNKTKRRRGFPREEADQSTEESVGNEQDYELQDVGVSHIHSPTTASALSDQNHPRGFPSARPSSPPWKITDGVMGVTVPRKARSASTKRSHDSWLSTSGGEDQNFRHHSNSSGRHSVEVASPSTSNVSLKKKMKANGPKTRLPKTTKSSSSTQEDIEFEIAEVLYGLMTSKDQESSQKLEPNGGQADKKKVGDYNSSTLGSTNSTSKLVKTESSQPANVETFSHELAKISGINDDNSTGCETKSSEASKEEIKKDKLVSSARCGVTYGSDSFRGESPSPSKLDVDQEGSAATKVVVAVPPDANSQREEKFKIDLMAPPPMVLSPEMDDLSKGNFTSELRDLVLEVELKTENNIKTEDKVGLNKNAPEEIRETWVDTYKEKQDILKIDLEMPNKDIDCLTRDKLEEMDKNQGLPHKLTDPKVEKIDKSIPVSLLTTVPAWSSILSPSLGYVPPPQTVKIDKTTGLSLTPQQANFALSPPQSKRCATHHYIARNIFLHQQFMRMNHIRPAAIGSDSLCGANPNNINSVPTSETMVDGHQSQKKFPSVNLNASQAKKELTALGIPGLHPNKSPDATNSLDSTQKKQQGPYPASTCNVMNGSAFLCSLGQHQTTSITGKTSQAKGLNSTSSAPSSNKSNSSSTGSQGTSSALPAVAATMSFSYPNLAANDAPYVTIVQNNGYSFPFSTPQGATASMRGASPAPAAHVLNGPFYSSQIYHPFQHPQPHPHSQAFVQPSFLNTSTSISSSLSHKQPRGAQVNGSSILSSTTKQLQQSQKQSTSQSNPRKLETKTSGENATSVASQTSYSQKNVHGQNFTIPVQPVNLSFRPSTTSDSVGGNHGNFGDKKQQASKGGVDLVPSQAFGISFAAFNGTGVPSNLSFSSMTQSPVIFHSLPNVAWQGYHSAGTSHSTQQKSYSMPVGKNGGNSARHDDEKKVNSGKSSTNGPTTLVFDNSSKNLSFALSPTHGSWPSHSVSSPAITTNAPLSSNTSSSQQLLQLQKQHNVQQQPPSLANTRYKASTSTTSASKFVNNPSVFSQTFSQCNNSNPSPHSKSSGRTSDSQVLHTPVITATASTIKNVSQEQGRVLQGHTHTQISFGGNYKSSLHSQGQHQLNNNQHTTFASTPNGSKPKPNSQGSKIGSSINNLQTQQAENSSVGSVNGNHIGLEQSHLKWHSWTVMLGGAYSPSGVKHGIANWSVLIASPEEVEGDFDVEVEHSNAGCGGIIRDHKGEWIGGFTSHIGSCSALDAEFWGILKGLAFTKKKGLNSIMVECDSKEAITLIDKAKSSGFSFNQFINRIIMLASDIGRVTFLHNFREANTCADWLAKFSLSSNVGLVKLVDPPSDLMRFIARDKLGITTCRVGPV